MNSSERPSGLRLYGFELEMRRIRMIVVGGLHEMLLPFDYRVYRCGSKRLDVAVSNSSDIPQTHQRTCVIFVQGDHCLRLPVDDPVDLAMHKNIRCGEVKI